MFSWTEGVDSTKGTCTGSGAWLHLVLLSSVRSDQQALPVCCLPALLCALLALSSFHFVSLPCVCCNETDVQGWFQCMISRKKFISRTSYFFIFLLSPQIQKPDILHPKFSKPFYLLSRFWRVFVFFFKKRYWYILNEAIKP
jgi:hypothetical protein